MSVDTDITIASNRQEMMNDPNVETVHETQPTQSNVSQSNELSAESTCQRSQISAHGASQSNVRPDDQIPTTSTGQRAQISVFELLRRQQQAEQQQQSSSSDSNDSVVDSSQENSSHERSASNSSSIHSNVTDVGDENVRGGRIRWVIGRTFDTEREMDEFIKSEGCWGTRSTNRKEGTKLYRCNLVPVKGVQCAAELSIKKRVDVPSDSEDDEKVTFEVLRNGHEHTHNQNAGKKVRITDTLKKKIIELHIQGKKRQEIMYALRDDEEIPDENQPTKRQNKNVTQKYDREQYGAKPFTMIDLTNFIGQHKAVPEDEDKPFVVEFERSASNEKEREFRFFVSTPRLLRLASNSNIIHADATHKVTREKLPLLVIGTTDE